MKLNFLCLTKLTKLNKPMFVPGTPYPKTLSSMKAETFVFNFLLNTQFITNSPLNIY